MESAEQSRTRRDRGGLENQILAALAAARGPLTPAQVLAQVDDSLAYTTVMTALARLHRKAMVTRERVGRAYAYSWVDDSSVAAMGMLRLLDSRPDRAGVLARFFDELDPDDVPVLQRLLEQADGT